jgi:subtilisin family serine protease
LSALSFPWQTHFAIQSDGSDTTIIVLPEDVFSFAQPASVSTARPVGRGSPKMRRKVRQSFLHRAFEELPDRRAVNRTLSFSQAYGPVAALSPDLAVAAAATASPRFKALDALGVILATDLTPAVRERLEAAGAEVCDNALVDLVNPSSSSAVAENPPGQPPWHLTWLGINPSANPEAGKGVVIGFLDTGIDVSHPEFAGRRVRFQEFDAAGRPCGDKPEDYGKHGTHVAAIAAGSKLGLAPAAEIAMAAVLTVRVEGKNYGHVAQILSGLQWLLDSMSADTDATPIVNASLSIPGKIAKFEKPLRQAHELGVLIVAAVGNDGQADPVSPAHFESVLSVGATDPNDVVAPFSNWGTLTSSDGRPMLKPDLCAPGVEIYSAKAGGGYMVMSGTSMAAPIVAGMAARLVGNDKTLAGRLDAIRSRLIDRSRLATPRHEAGNGMVDSAR